MAAAAAVVAMATVLEDEGARVLGGWRVQFGSFNYELEEGSDFKKRMPRWLVAGLSLSNQNHKPYLISFLPKIKKSPNYSYQVSTIAEVF